MITEQEHTVHNFHVDSDNQVRIECPECGLARFLNAEGFRYVRDVFIFSCQCGAEFRGAFDFRNGWMRRVNLGGEYYNPRSDDSDEMRIEVLSMDGLAFRTLGRHSIERGDILNINFRLDNVLSTEIRRQARVLNVTDTAIEVEFHRRPPYDPDLGFYLMP